MSHFHNAIAAYQQRLHWLGVDDYLSNRCFDQAKCFVRWHVRDNGDCHYLGVLYEVVDRAIENRRQKKLEELEAKIERLAA